MKHWLRSRWVWLGLVVVFMPFGAILFLRQSSYNIMYPALDKLASLDLSERWSHPEMLKIRHFGKKAIPPLRRVLREKDKPMTRFLFWAKGKWPIVTKYVPYLPDAQKMTERRWTACQVLQTLGPLEGLPRRNSSRF